MLKKQCVSVLEIVGKNNAKCQKSIYLMSNNTIE